MSLTGITFANQKITPSDDGRLYGAMLADGILTGCGITFAAATLSVAAGSLLIGTRELRTSGETLSITGATSGYARVIVDIDLTRAATNASFEQAQFQVEYAASPDAFPALVQQDINAAGTHFQSVFCVVSLSEAGITGIVSSLGESHFPPERLLIPGNAGAHNAVYRGKNLGSAVTAAQWAAIQAGTFEDLFIGDYWTINGVNWNIAAFDFYLGTGDETRCTDHHAVIVPGVNLYLAKMNDTNTVVGAYVGSKLRGSGLGTAKTTINNAFGSEHILSHRQFLKNAVTDTYESGGSWYDSTVELMTEQNVYGGKIMANCLSGTQWAMQFTIDKSQFPLFSHRPDLISDGITYWLRDVASSSAFCRVGDNGNALNGNAGETFGVRPAFCIK